MAKVHVPHIVPVVSFPCVSFHCSCSLAQAGEKAKLKKLQQLFHRRYVMGVDLKTKQAMMIFVAVLVILVVVMLAISITAFALDDPVAGSVTLVCTVSMHKSVAPVQPAAGRDISQFSNHIADLKVETCCKNS
eukprot:GHVT01069052.1.p2 GENE.GHVT01069052.1~~GHVT01069052.1.p2  ORF type:complete len:133 (-),score=9.05 GHVT01069052.1:750-1148(-)